MTSPDRRPPDEPARYAVVGLGHIAQAAMLPAFAHADNSRLAALVSGDPVKRQKLSREYAVDRVVDYDGLEELYASGAVDAVYISVPNHRHAEMAVQAARAGIHVLVEKPMAVTEQECEQMIAACADADVRLMVAYRLHFDEANLEVLRHVRDGSIGEPRFFASVFSQDVAPGDIRLMPLEQGGGSVYDMGVYCINAARYLFSAEPVEVLATTASGPDERFEDCDEMTSVTLRFPGDRLATFTSSFGAHEAEAYRVVGTAGEIRMSPCYSYVLELAYELEAEGASRSRTFPRRDQFGPQLVYFSDCIRRRVAPEPDGNEGLADVRIVQAVYRSARTGRAIALDPVEPQERPRLEQAMRRPPVDEPEEIHASSPKEG